MFLTKYQKIQALVIIMLLCLSFSTLAFPEDSNNITEEVCVEMDTYAYNVMHGRQNGVAQSKMYGIINGIDMPVTIKALLIGIVNEAYKIPYYHTDSMKAHAITEFRNMVFQACVSNL